VIKLNQFAQKESMSAAAMNHSAPEALLSFLQSAKRSMSPREIRLGLAAKGVRLSEHEIIANLRYLHTNNFVSCDRGRWHASLKQSEISDKQDFTPASLSLPSLSTETYALLKRAPTIVPAQSSSIDPDKNDSKFLGPWGNFRALVEYYRECIRTDGNAEASAILSEENDKFLFLPVNRKKLPTPGQPWSIAVPFGEHLSRLVQRIGSQGDDSLLILGYPLQIVHVGKENEPDMHFLKPIFYLPATCDLKNGALIAQIESTAYQVNLDWLQHTFNTPEKKRAFLSACGFFANEAEDGAQVSDYSSPSIHHLTTTLAAFCGHRLAEPLLSDEVPTLPLHPPLGTGVYNRAILMVASRPQYTKTLLRELSQILNQSDSTLDKTALSLLFREKNDDLQPHRVVATKLHVAETISLNEYQRNATGSLLNDYLTVITGPPGTGKSQVVSALIANAHLYGRPVLFASRNHKAIDAVYDRCRDTQMRPLLTRCNSQNDPSLKITFSKAIQQLLEGSSDQNAASCGIRLLDELLPLLEDRHLKLCLAKQHEDWQDRIGRLEHQVSQLQEVLPSLAIETLLLKPHRFPTQPLLAVEEAILRTRVLLDSGSRNSWFKTWLRSLAIIPSWIRLQRGLSLFPGIKVPIKVLPTPSKLMALYGQLTVLRDASNFCVLRKEILAIEPEIRKLPDHAALTDEIKKLHERVIDLAPRSLERRRASTGGLTSGEERETLANLRTVLNDLTTGIVDGKLKSVAHDVLQEQLPRLFHHFPCWAVTSLSAGSRIPLLPAIFDLIVIDEASQSDIPSAIPLLFRARRAGVVGDPHQLTHITGLTRAKDTMLRRRFGLSRLRDQRFSYVDTSLYNLFADTTGVIPAFLKTTYRSAPEIAEYSNDLFYGGRLEVATNTSRLMAVPGFKTGVHWTQIEGAVKSGGISGAWCAAEVQMVATQVDELLINGFRGTLGVVTPFREQANRIRDAIHDNCQRWELLQAVEFEVSTSHGFQGGERDVILFSLCAGPGMPKGALTFLRETGNLFNVAVSRARAVLHVIGNKDWASHCGIRHIEKLANPIEFGEKIQNKAENQWAPHESPWEQKLYLALLQHGVSPVPQHPVANRRLDLALFRSDLRIDIEVDGASFHRNPDGTRKTEDIWRDIQLIGMGWKVFRFWVYQLREDMDGCVKKIMDEWEKSHENRK
jgi:very-short-patch-repair endonuclease